MTQVLTRPGQWRGRLVRESRALIPDTVSPDSGSGLLILFSSFPNLVALQTSSISILVLQKVAIVPTGANPRSYDIGNTRLAFLQA